MKRADRAEIAPVARKHTEKQARSVQHAERRDNLEPLALLPTTPDSSPTTPSTPSYQLRTWNKVREEPSLSTKDWQKIAHIVKMNGSIASDESREKSKLKTFSLVKPESFPRPSSIPQIESFHEPQPRPISPIMLQRTETPAKISPIASVGFEEFEKIPRISEIPGISEISRKRSTNEGVWAKLFTTSKTFGKILLRRTSVGKSTLQKHDSNLQRPLDALTARKAYKRSYKRNAKKRGEKCHGILSRVFTQTNREKRVFIPPPKPISSISKLMLTFKKEKDIPDIKEHTVEPEKVAQMEDIKSHLEDIKSPSPIEAIKIQPVANIEKIPSPTNSE